MFASHIKTQPRYKNCLILPKYKCQQAENRINLCRLLEPKWISKHTHFKKRNFHGITVFFEFCSMCMHCVFTLFEQEKKRRKWGRKSNRTGLLVEATLFQSAGSGLYGLRFLMDVCGSRAHLTPCLFWWQALPPSSFYVICGIGGLKVAGVMPSVQGDPGLGFFFRSHCWGDAFLSMCTERTVTVMGLQTAIWPSRGEGCRQMRPVQRKAELRDKTPDPAAPAPQ